MNYTFQIQCVDFDKFVTHWSSKYTYKDGHKYNSNIGNPLTKESRKELYEWKNGSVLSKNKMESVIKNYPLSFNGDLKERYLNHKKNGGAIWNIFYIHCLDPDSWPIFDQHVFRAMCYLKTNTITEIGNTNKRKYEQYLNEYIPFTRSLLTKSRGEMYYKTLDEALFSFGQFLKKAKEYAHSR